MEIISLVISVIAFLFSVCTYCAHDYKLKKQEEAINRLTLEQLQEEQESQKKAQLLIEIKVCEYGSGKLFIYNEGKSVARNIRIGNFDETKLCINDTDILPFEFLNPNDNFPIDITIFEGGKLNVSIEWDDDFAINRTKKQILVVE